MFVFSTAFDESANDVAIVRGPSVARSKTKTKKIKATGGFPDRSSDPFAGTVSIPSLDPLDPATRPRAPVSSAKDEEDDERERERERERLNEEGRTGG